MADSRDFALRSRATVDGRRRARPGHGAEADDCDDTLLFYYFRIAVTALPFRRLLR